MWLGQEARWPDGEKCGWGKSEGGKQCEKYLTRISQGSSGQEKSRMLLGPGPHFEN